MVLVVKNPPDHAGNIRDVGSIHGSGRSPAWRIPWTEEPGRLVSIGLYTVGHN